MIGRLAGGIAHDYNNLLTVILGHAELLIQELPTGGVAAERLAVLHAAARRAADLTDQLLTFSQHREVSEEPTDVNEVVSSMEVLLHRVVGERIEVCISLCDGRAVVGLDRSQIREVVLNLVLNAREAMPHGGALGIITEMVPSAVGPGDVCLHVSDTGTGIDDSTRALIFEPFFSTKPETKLTGLGLSSVFGLVTQHGGGVDFSSRPGAGSVFTVMLPEWGGTNQRSSARSDEKRPGYPPG